MCRRFAPSAGFVLCRSSKHHSPAKSVREEFRGEAGGIEATVASGQAFQYEASCQDEDSTEGKDACSIAKN